MIFRPIRLIYRVIARSYRQLLSGADSVIFSAEAITVPGSYSLVRGLLSGCEGFLDVERSDICIQIFLNLSSKLLYQNGDGLRMAFFVVRPQYLQSNQLGRSGESLILSPAEFLPESRRSRTLP